MEILKSYKNIHFIGILGSSMSSLAIIMKAEGYEITGSDASYNPRYNALKEKGIFAYIGCKAEECIKADIVVYTSAIPDDNIELQAARNKGIPCITRADFLGIIASSYAKVISVAGTHGKTTATGMLGQIYKEAKANATVHIGGQFSDSEALAITEGHERFITEACEYRSSFLTLKSDIAIVLNIESDHPDYYKDINQIRSAFAKFIKNTKVGGVVIMSESAGIECNNAIIIGRDVRATEIIEKNGRYSFVPEYFGNIGNRISLKLYGEHNVYNALVAYTCAKVDNIEDSIITKALSNFLGIKGRFETIKIMNGARIIRDYAHHPTEIRAVVNAAQKTAKGRLIVFFQPHTYSRTEKLMSEFLTCFLGCDRIIIVEEFAAREKITDGKSAYDLYVALKNTGECLYSTVNNARGLLKEIIGFDDTVLLLGAGDMAERIVID